MKFRGSTHNLHLKLLFLSEVEVTLLIGEKKRKETTSLHSLKDTEEIPTSSTQFAQDLDLAKVRV